MTEDEMVVWHHHPMDTRLSKLWEMVKDRELWHARAHRLTNSQTQLTN